MPTYFEGEAPTVVSTGGYNGCGNGMWGGDGAWWIAIFLIFAIFGFGGRGFGNFGGGSNETGYELGKLATQADIASGFANSTVLSNLGDLKLGQAGIQQTMCQGFSGVNNAIERNGYETRLGINDLGYKMQDCCCSLSRQLDGINYNMAKNTCDIIQAGNCNTQRIIDFLTNDKIESLNRELTLAQSQLSQNAQTRTIIDSIMPVARPAYITCSPYASAYGYPYGFNGNCNSNCGL